MSDESVPIDHAIGKLASGSFFYAMRSCEYLKVSGPRKTKLLLVEDIQFHVANREINHSSPQIFDSDTVTITFKDQKNGELMQSRTAWRTNDPLLCPVNAWASIVARIVSYPGCNKQTSVNTVLVNGRLIQITAAMMVTSIRSAASTLGRDRLGFLPKQVDPIYTTKTNIGRDAPRQFHEMPRLLLAS
jgi:hypothetical protein